MEQEISSALPHRIDLESGKNVDKGVIESLKNRIENLSRTNKNEFSGLKEQYEILSEHLSQNSNLALQLQGLNLQKHRLILAGAIAFLGLVQLSNNDVVMSALTELLQTDVGTLITATVLVAYGVREIKKKF